VALHIIVASTATSRHRDRRRLRQRPDYQQLSTAAETFKGLIGKGAIVRAARAKAQGIGHHRIPPGHGWLRDEAERGVNKQRYKGLGEMNPSSCGKPPWTRPCAAC
jgi:DNA gyrase/topoisomerase IV subunit B